MKQINQPIEDETFRKLFDVDQKLYEQSSFLRSIKSNYLRFKNLSDKQIEMFKKVAEEMATGKVTEQVKAAPVIPAAEEPKGLLVPLKMKLAAKTAKTAKKKKTQSKQ
jgi:hypothetical protein